MLKMLKQLGKISRGRSEATIALVSQLISLEIDDQSVVGQLVNRKNRLFTLSNAQLHV